MVYDAISVVFYAVIYSLECSGILCICAPYPCQYGEPADLLSICNLCKTFPLPEQEGTGHSLLPSNSSFS